MRDNHQIVYNEALSTLLRITSCDIVSFVENLDSWYVGVISEARCFLTKF